MVKYHPSRLISTLSQFDLRFFFSPMNCLLYFSKAVEYCVVLFFFFTFSDCEHVSLLHNLGPHFIHIGIIHDTQKGAYTEYISIRRSRMYDMNK